MARFPGESGARQPVHTVYGGAHLFKSDTTQKLGALALRALDEYGPDAATLGDAIGTRSALSRRRLRARRSRSCAASRSKTSASISKTATATAPMTKKTATPPPPRRKWRRG